MAEAIDNTIPCEHCNNPIEIDDWMLHTQQCTNEQKYQKNNTEKSTTNDVIPCEYCTKSFAVELIEDHKIACGREHPSLESRSVKKTKNTKKSSRKNGSSEQVADGLFAVPERWNRSSSDNLSRYTLNTNSGEYRFVKHKFDKKLQHHEIIQIERIQNRRWYRQYAAHKAYFIERYGESTEEWLFHGCKGKSVNGIINDCFNRSHAVRCAAGQGIYFSTDANISFFYTQPDEDDHRHMFLARVLVGERTHGNPATRFCPNGYDTTGEYTVFVTYHDAQAYGEYLITFR